MMASPRRRMAHGSMGDARVFAVIPVHNRWNLTRECLRSLESQSYPALRVVVVDDGSTDGTAEFLAREFPQVMVLRGDGDLWWTGATNVGAEWVLERCGARDYVLALNNDTTVGPDYVEQLVRVAQSAGSVLVGSVAVDSRDGDTIADGGARVNWWTARSWSENAGESLSACLALGVMASAPDLLSGRGTLVSAACLRHVGLWAADRLPHYAADYEFSVRAARAGFGLVMSYAAPVFSEVEATGLTTRHGRLPWASFFRMFVSRRSPACLVYRWRFARMAAPGVSAVMFIVADTARVIGGALRDQIRGGVR